MQIDKYKYNVQWRQTIFKVVSRTGGHHLANGVQQHAHFFFLKVKKKAQAVRLEFYPRLEFMF